VILNHKKGERTEMGKKQDEYDFIKARYLFDGEWSRSVTEIQKLLMLARNDPIVHHYLNEWEHGCYQSFEVMLCALVQNLVKEKQDHLNTITKLSLSTMPTKFIIEPGEDAKKAISSRYPTTKEGTKESLGNTSPPSVV